MLTKNTFHLYLYIKDYKLLLFIFKKANVGYWDHIVCHPCVGDFQDFDDIFNAPDPEGDSKYYGFLASALCSPCLELLPFI